MKKEIVLLPTEETAQLSEAYCEEHFPKRMERAAGFRRREDRLRCIGAGALLSGILGIREDEMVYSEHKKPFVSNSTVCFNISHSGDYVLLATDHEEVGADIEMVDPVHLKLSEHIFVPEELAWIKSDPLNRFFMFWTLKESVMKQCGLGLLLKPDSFSVMPLLDGKSIDINGRALFAATTYIDRHYISVCTPHPIEALIPKIVSAADIEKFYTVSKQKV